MPPMKTILLPVLGKYSDVASLETRLAAARVFGAHFLGLHVRMASGAMAKAALTPEMEGVSLTLRPFSTIEKDEAALVGIARTLGCMTKRVLRGAKFQSFSFTELQGRTPCSRRFS
jgi:hypothetical protein